MPSAPPRELQVAAAYFRLLGYSQETIGKKIRRTTRTIRYWKELPEWASIEQEARSRLNRNLTGYARRAVRRGLLGKDGGWLALEILGRFDSDWLPPQQRLKIDMEREEAERLEADVDNHFELMHERFIANSNGSTKPAF